MAATQQLIYRVHSQQYRRRVPEDADEEEFMENVFDSLAAALTEPEIKKLFMDAEGIDLMVLMMKWVIIASISSSNFDISIH